MTCDKVRAELTAYLDGELADERGSAVRGHLRNCAACRGVAADEAALRDGLRTLPPVDPPASLWAGVQARLAAAEVADAEKPAWRRALARWMPRAPQLALGGAIAAAALALVIVRAQHTDDSTVSPPAPVAPVVVAPAPTNDQAAAPPASPAVDDGRDVTEVLASAPARVSDDYAAVVRELVPLAREARPRWTEERQREFDTQLAELEQRVSTAKTERDRQRSYRALIRYLQRAAIRDEVALASVIPGASR